MSIGLQERQDSGEALSNAGWRKVNRPRRETPWRNYGVTDITSASRPVTICFGGGVLEFPDPPPFWSYEMLARISELGELEDDWDSYGARPVDPHCAAAAADLLLSFLGPSAPKPSIVPTSRGGIQLEWHRAGADLEIEIESPARFYVSFEDERAGEEKEITLSNNLLPLRPLLNRLTQVD